MTSPFPAAKTTRPNNPFSLLDVIRLNWVRQDNGYCAMLNDATYRIFTRLPDNNWLIRWSDEGKERKMQLDGTLNAVAVAEKLTRWHLNNIMIGWSNPPKPFIIQCCAMVTSKHPGTLAQHLSKMLAKPIDVDVSMLEAFSLIDQKMASPSQNTNT